MPDESRPDAQTRVTWMLAEHIAGLRYQDLPPAAISQARRGVLDWLGCALAASRHPTLDTLLSVIQDLGALPQASVFGRGCKVGTLDAALINGQMGHILDYDDTHTSGVLLHPSSPILPALFALAERAGGVGGNVSVSGIDFIMAYVAGFEAGVRIGHASPGHHKGGWHLTGTLGSLAASAAAAKLLGLNARQTVHALGIGATQAAGMQQNRGTMCKSFHAGKAAANGLLAAKLAQRGFDSSEEIVEGKRGFCRIYSDIAAPEKIIDELGRRWEITRNGHKPYACGVVLHPAIDALIGIRALLATDRGANAEADARQRADAIDEVVLHVHPLVLSITGVAEPATGLQSKFSIYHSAAVALLDGAAGAFQYTDERAADPAVIALRGKVKVVIDDTLANDQAHARVSAAGRVHEFRVDHASGTVGNPMSDAAIESKFLANAGPVIGAERAARVCERVWKLEQSTDVRELIELCR